MGQWLECFKAYDVRGKVPSELNEEIAYRIGRAFAEVIRPKSVCLGYDARLSGPSLLQALAKGLNDSGSDVIDLGMVGTEMVYFATAYYGYDGGMMITASHNPAEYNGIKMVRQESRPISSDSGLGEIEKLAFENQFSAIGTGTISQKDVYPDYVNHLLKMVAPNQLKPLKVLASPGNGAAGPLLEKLLPHLPLQVTGMDMEPDGRFPHGVPNPILPEARKRIEDRLRESDFDFGVAWDGDYDRCFFLDEKGEFIEGYYIVGLLAQDMLTQHPGASIVIDPRLIWNSLDIISDMGGKAVLCKSGHAFIKEKMREVDAVYGGEMSAHHYFKESWYTDGGMPPFLMVARLVSASGKSLGELVAERIERFPCSGEINSTVANVAATLDKVERHYPGGVVSKIDGLSIEFDNWRFNLRGSNTEPVIRLNVETRGDRSLLEQKTKELLSLIRE
jgi:phosphomannomutase